MDKALVVDILFSSCINRYYIKQLAMVASVSARDTSVSFQCFLRLLCSFFYYFMYHFIVLCSVWPMNVSRQKNHQFPCDQQRRIAVFNVAAKK